MFTVERYMTQHHAISFIVRTGNCISRMNVTSKIGLVSRNELHQLEILLY
jgi:hypothetical protein